MRNSRPSRSTSAHLHVAAAAASIIATTCLGTAALPADPAPCDGFVLAEGVTCVPDQPPLDPEHASEGAFEGGDTGTSEDAGVNINAGNLADSGGNFDIPTGAPPSPLFGAQPWTQRMLRFEEFGPESLPCETCVSPGDPFPSPPNADSGPDSQDLDDYLRQGIYPYPTRHANETDRNPWETQIETFLGRQLDDPPCEGRPPGENWAHQRWDEFYPEIYFNTAQAGARTNLGLRDARQSHGYAVGEWGPTVLGREGQTGLYYNTTGVAGFEGTTAGIEVKFHSDFPVQDPNALWTWDGTFPPKLLAVRYGFPILMRHYNALPIDPSANFGFGLHTISTHEHNGHTPAESDGYTQAFFFPGQFYDYRWPLQLAGYDTINTTASDPRAGTPDGSGGIIPLRGDWRETMSTHWFHDHMLDFTAQNVYKGNAAMMNYYSSVDRGREPANAAEAAGNPATPGYGCHYANPANVNLCFPSGSSLDWGNRDYDVNLLIADKAWDRDGQLFFNIFNLDGFLGDRILTNWLWNPYFDVRARRYRFRILNGSVSRYFRFALVTENDEPVPCYMVLNDGNVMEHAVYFPGCELPTQGIAERYDIIVDFGAYAPGTKIYMLNTLEHRNGRRPHEDISIGEILSGEYRAVLDGNQWEDADPAVGKFLEFRVTAYDGVDLSMDPAEYVAGGKTMIPLPGFTQTELDNAIHRVFEFGRSSGTDEAPWTIKTDGGQGFAMDPRRLSAAPARDGAVEIWRLETGGGWSHPIHVHFEEGQILERGGAPPPEWERWARKDVYRIGRMDDSQDSVVFAIRFREFLGSYMEHCHNTQHEDHAMLLRWDIENPGQVVVMPTPMPTWDGVTYVDSFALPTFRTGDLNAAGNSDVCGDGERNQPSEHCDGTDDAGCPGQCLTDCTCPGSPVCGDGLVNQPTEDCDGADDADCPGQCQSDCICAVFPTCGDDLANHADEDCDGADDAACPGACRIDCTCPPPTTTTTTTQPAVPVTLFCDTFDNGLASWTESGEGDWNTEALHSASGYPASGSGSPAAHSDNCDTGCTITLAAALDLRGHSAATLDLLRFVDSGLDPGEFLRLEAWNGSTWQALADWSAASGADTDQWHAHSYDLGAYLGRSDFRFRFVTRQSSRDEHVHADDVCIRAISGGLPLTTTTLPTTTTTAPTTSTTAPTTSTTTPATTTTSTLPPGAPVTLFCDTFDDGLASWNESGEGDWNTEALHSSSGYPSGGSESHAAHSDDCDTTCTITLRTAIDLTGRTSAQLTLLRFLDSELDEGEYLRLQAWDGHTWQTLADWTADMRFNTDRWHAHTIDLAPYLGRADFRIRLVTHQSNDREHVHVDDVCVTAAGGNAAATTTTMAPATVPTTTTTVSATTTTTAPPPPAGVVAEILADTHTEEKDEDRNFGNDEQLSADADSEKNVLVRVRVTGLGGPTTSARIRLTVVDESGADSSSGGRIRRINDCAWSEHSVTFETQPALTGTSGPDVGPVSRRGTVDFDVTSHVTGDGTYCFAITSNSSNDVRYNSREARANRPSFVVTR
jgi:FtsP/CotA-like multicopper oxidase with cupredoxin domain